MEPHLTKEDIDAIADGAYDLLHGAEETVRDLKPARSEAYELATRALLVPFLRRVLPLFTMDEIEAIAYESALERSGGDTAAAARALGVSRSTIYNRARAQAPRAA